MDVVVWLRSLGLGKYEAAFRENEIDETVLPNLTVEDLKELGVTALGHRRKLLAAIAAMLNDASGKVPSVDPATTSSGPTSQILGTPRLHEPRTPLARPRQSKRSARNCWLQCTGGSPKALIRAI